MRGRKKKSGWEKKVISMVCVFVTPFAVNDFVHLALTLLFGFPTVFTAFRAVADE